LPTTPSHRRRRVTRNSAAATVLSRRSEVDRFGKPYSHVCSALGDHCDRGAWRLLLDRGSAANHARAAERDRLPTLQIALRCRNWPCGQNPGRKPAISRRARARETQEPRRTGFDLQGQLSSCRPLRGCSDTAPGTAARVLLKRDAPRGVRPSSNTIVDHRVPTGVDASGRQVAGRARTLRVQPYDSDSDSDSGSGSGSVARVRSMAFHSGAASRRLSIRATEHPGEEKTCQERKKKRAAGTEVRLPRRVRFRA
jgi:hypothetical protein